MLDIFQSDMRAIEGLLVRLVAALAVGAASMSVMPNMLSGAQGSATLELDVKPVPDAVGSGEQALDFTVVDREGNPVESTTVIMKSGITEIDDMVAAKSDDGGSTTVNVDAEFGTNHEDGMLVVDVRPPTGESFVGRCENTNVLVVQG